MPVPDPFGFGLKLADGDIALRGGQLAMVAGTANLLQALELRVQTPYGSDRFNVTYGLDVAQIFTQPGSVRITKHLISLNLVRTIGTDPRVSDVTDVIFADDPAYLARHPDSKVADQLAHRLWNVDVVIATADGQSAILPVTLGA